MEKKQEVERVLKRYVVFLQDNLLNLIGKEDTFEHELATELLALVNRLSACNYAVINQTETAKESKPFNTYGEAKDFCAKFGFDLGLRGPNSHISYGYVVPYFEIAEALLKASKGRLIPEALYRPEEDPYKSQ